MQMAALEIKQEVFLSVLPPGNLLSQNCFICENKQ